MDSLAPRQFGVELELSRRLLCVNYQDRMYSSAWQDVENMLMREADIGNISNRWRLKVDTSCGGEVVSPPMFGHGGFKQLAIVCDKLRRIAKNHNSPAVDGECGLHIHLDAAEMEPKHLSRLFSLVHAAEPIIFSMYPNRNFDYCMPVEVNMRQAARFRDWTDVRDVWYRGQNNVKQRDKYYGEKFINGTSPGDHYDGTRYHGFNIHCYWNIGTVEFRYGAGTLDPLHIKAYYQMCLSMMNTALSDKELDIPSDISNTKYEDLSLYYRSNYRFRKFIRKIAKLCGFSRDTVRLITNLVREHNPALLEKAPKLDGDILYIDEKNMRDYVYRYKTDYFGWAGRRIVKPSENDKRKIIDVELVKHGRHYLIWSNDPRIVIGINITVKSSAVSSPVQNADVGLPQQAYADWANIQTVAAVAQPTNPADNFLHYYQAEVTEPADVVENNEGNI